MIPDFIRSFLLIFIAEMGDKTQILAMAFATQFKVEAYCSESSQGSRQSWNRRHHRLLSLRSHSDPHRSDHRRFLLHRIWIVDLKTGKRGRRNAKEQKLGSFSYGGCCIFHRRIGR